MSTLVPLDTKLTAIGRDPQTLGEWLTTFQMAAVVLDPYTHESAWILETARRILTHFTATDVRIAFIVAGTTDEAERFLGPLTKEILTLADEDRSFIKAAGLESLPAFLHIAQEGSIVAQAEGWNPSEWNELAMQLARRMHWNAPLIPAVGDPTPYPGSPAVS